MKKTFLTGVAVLFLATGTAHADELPDKFIGEWCYADGDVWEGAIHDHGPCTEKDKFGEEYTVQKDYADGVNVRYVFDKITQTATDTYIIHTAYYVRSEGTGELHESPLRNIYLELKIVEGELIVRELELSEG